MLQKVNQRILYVTYAGP